MSLSTLTRMRKRVLSKSDEPAHEDLRRKRLRVSSSSSDLRRSILGESLASSSVRSFRRHEIVSIPFINLSAFVSSLNASSDRIPSHTVMTRSAASISRGQSAVPLYSVVPLHQVALQVLWCSVSVALRISTKVAWRSCVVCRCPRYVPRHHRHIPRSRTSRLNTI